MESLFEMDSVRIMTLLEIVQYGILYFVLGFFMGATLETLFPRFDEKKPVHEVVLEVLGQTIAFLILIFYIRKIVKLVPFLFMIQSGRVLKYEPYRTAEYEGEMTIGLVVIASQINLLKKIDLLSREFYSQIMGLEVRAGSIL